MFGDYPLVMTNSLLLNIAMKIVDFPIDSIVLFHSYVSVPEGNLVPEIGLSWLFNLPSGNLLQFAVEIHHAINGKIHKQKNGHFPVRYVSHYQRVFIR